MCPHQESNLDLGLRSPLFYPLNYGGRETNSKCACLSRLYPDETERENRNVTKCHSDSNKKPGISKCNVRF